MFRTNQRHTHIYQVCRGFMTQEQEKPIGNVIHNPQGLPNSLRTNTNTEQYEKEIFITEMLNKHPLPLEQLGTARLENLLLLIVGEVYNVTLPIGIQSLGVDFRQISIGNKQHIAVFHNSGGQESIQSTGIAQLDLDAIIICFDLSTLDSIESIEHWIRSVSSYCCPYTPLYLVGTKNDLPLKITQGQITRFVQRMRSNETLKPILYPDVLNLRGYISTSTKTGDGLSKLEKIAIQKVKSKKKSKRDIKPKSYSVWRSVFCGVLQSCNR